MNNSGILSKGKEALKDKFPPLLYVKHELFDHLIYPLSVKLDDNSIIQLFRKLHIMSSIDYKITCKEWVEQSTTNLVGFTEKEAHILFVTYKIYMGDLEQNKKETINSRYDTSGDNSNNIKNQEKVDVRYFGLFFALQLFNQRAKILSIDTRDKNPYSINQNHNSNFNYNNYSSPLSSPRGKGSSSARSGATHDYQIWINFVKTNIKLFLRLIASDIHSTETTLNSNEFNTLKFFFKIFGADGNDSNYNTHSYSENGLLNAHSKTLSNTLSSIHNSTSLSSIAPFFMNFSSTTKINIEIINDWLNNVIFTVPSNLTTSYSAIDFLDLVSLKNLSKCVTIKDNIKDKNLKISQCEDSYIYINSNVSTVKISNCYNCTIMVASVSKIATIDKCENCNITIATKLLRICNTMDSTIYSYSINEPVLFGDNRAVIMAPHNVYYTELPIHIKSAKFLNTSTVFMNNFAHPTLMHDSLNFQTMSPKDFSNLVVPFNNDKTCFLPLTPKDYVDPIKERETKVEMIKKLIVDAHLQEEQEKALHVAIQGYFREYLVTSALIKPMTDIVKMIDFSPTNRLRDEHL